MNKKIEIRIYSPSIDQHRRHRSTHTADMVILRLTSGDMGILPNHMPATMVLANGIARLYNDNIITNIVLSGGIAQVSDDIITILTNKAEVAETE